MTKNSFLFSERELDQNHSTLSISKDGLPLSKILKIEKYYYSIDLGSGGASIGIHSNLSGKYALSLYNRMNRGFFPDEELKKACRVRWGKFQTTRTTIESVNRAISKFLLLSNFK